MGYYLVDELEGVANSRRIIKRFDYYKDLKEWLVVNARDVYGFIPHMSYEKLPNFRSCRTVYDLKEMVASYTYDNWRLNIVTSRDSTLKSKKLVSRVEDKSWVTIRPMVTLKKPNCTDNGVMWAFVKELPEIEKERVLHAEVSRVLSSTPNALLVEWLGSKGTVVAWIPRKLLIY